MSGEQNKRIVTLDYLRGVMALSVMAYHYASDCGATLGSATLLGRLGVYAVSIFYILSGLSLALVYFGRIDTGGDILDFVVRRVFRIFPLFWIAVTSSVLFTWLSDALRGVPFVLPWHIAFLNYSLLFGFVAPSAYLTTGAWSIGNEMVFYAVFPLVVLFSRRAAYVLPLVLFASCLVAVFFAYSGLSMDQPLESQWNIYISPFNQMFLFVSGMALGAYVNPGKLRVLGRPAMLLGGVCIAAFSLLPAHGNPIALVTGWRRLLLSACCVLFVGCVLVTNLSVRGGVGRALGFLGEGCYSIYLLHPLVAMPITFLSRRYLPGHLVPAYTLAACLTLLVSWLTFRYVERPMIVAGRRAGEHFRTSVVVSAS